MKRRLRRPYWALLTGAWGARRAALVPPDAAIGQLGQAQSSQLDDPFDIYTWNICKGAAGFRFHHDFRQMCRRAPLILVQEALLSPALTGLYRHPGFEALHAASYERRDGLRDGVLTLSQVQASAPPLCLRGRGREIFLGTPKVALVTHYRLGDGQTLQVVNVHSRLFKTLHGTRQDMFHLLQSLPEHAGPLLVAGDFNTLTRAHLRALDYALGHAGLEHVEIPGDPRRPHNALDRVFVRQLRALDAEVDLTLRHSDHYALRVRLTAGGFIP